jgi:hypothetical protein
MDLIPLENLEPMEDNSYLSDRAIFSRSREIDRRLNQPKRKETFLDKVRAANELIGGVPRLAVEADEQPWELYRLQARLEAAEKTRNINHTLRILAPTIPPTALDGDITDVEFEEAPPGDPETN